LVREFSHVKLKILKVLLLLSITFILNQCLTVLDSSISSSENFNGTKRFYEDKVCIIINTIGVDHKFEVSNFMQIISEDLLEKSFQRTNLLESEVSKDCKYFLQYKKTKFSVAILELIVIGYPIIKGNEFEIEAIEYSKDRKIIRKKSMKNGYKHYISWLLFPTFFLLYRPYSDEKIIEDFHSRFFKTANEI
ncbi:hypothetical protein, partial [Leptospira stimsonii]